MKIFGIGLNKTGTSTLGKCLSVLGFNHHSYSGSLLREVVHGKFENLFALVEQHDSFDDWPFPLAYRALDHQFPGSKFILTTRESPQRWLNSLKSHALTTIPPCREKGIVSLRYLAYGFDYPQQNEEAHLSFYTHHNAAAQNYFRHRESDFLELCWEKEASWARLCHWLNKSEPSIPFPHERKASAPSQERRASNLLALRKLGIMIE